MEVIEGFFAKLTRQRLRRGNFGALVDLQAAIHRYIAEHNESTKPFVWTADPTAIIDKVRRAKLKRALATSQYYTGTVDSPLAFAAKLGASRQAGSDTCILR